LKCSTSLGFSCPNKCCLSLQWAGLSFFCSGRWLMVLRHD
jgi:hypothetical protein